MDNGRKFTNPLTGETRDLSGANYWHARKATSPAPVRATGKSAFASISLEDQHYERMCGLAQALEKQFTTGQLEFEDYAYARRSLDVRLYKAWKRLCKARGWVEDDSQTLPVENPVKSSQQDFSAIPDNSVFKGLSDGNTLKSTYLSCLIVYRQATHIIQNTVQVARHVFTEGLI